MVENNRKLLEEVLIWIVIFFVAAWFSSQNLAKTHHFKNETTYNSIFISAEVITLPDKLCLYWISTRDNYLRKSSYPCKHRYGLIFQWNTKNLHLLLCILLAGDIATNPGPASETKPTSGLDFVYLNARSLKAFVHVGENGQSKVCKISMLQELVYSAGYNVVCICETWLNETILDGELLPGYSIFRRDRKHKVGGGVLVAVKDNIRAKRRQDLERTNTELVVIELPRANGQPILPYTCYRPPGSTLDPIEQLSLSLSQLQESSSIVLVGDFNLTAIDWSLEQPSPSNTGGILEDKFCELIGDNFLEQLISGPTHRDGNKLDLLLCNTPEIIRNISTCSPEQSGFPSDHHIIEFSIQEHFVRAKQVRRTVFDYKRGNFEELRQSLAREPFDDTAYSDIDEHWTHWKEWFLNHASKHIPVKYVTDTNSPPWIDSEVRHFMRKKYQALRKYRQCKTAARKQKLRILSQDVKYLVRRKLRENLTKVKDSFQENPKHFWSFYKSIFRPRQRQSTDISYKGVTATTATHKAELFNSYFSSVFTTPQPYTNPDAVTSLLPSRTDEMLSNITVTVDEVANCLLFLDTTKAGGPDGISSRLLTECSHQIAPSLLSLFNRSLELGKIPGEWKSANAKERELAENYRPISLLSITSKILERCVYNRLYNQVLHLITSHQHGFLTHRSCITQLVQVLHFIGENLDRNIQTDILYLDLAKAFDSVDHPLLLQKLRCYGVTGRLLDWFSDYLKNRLQRVVVDGAASEWAPVTSGVPQGSILGPLLFVIFINDTPEVTTLGTSSALFADDTKLFRSIRSLEDCDHLQQSLTNLDNWSGDNNMSFNVSKCKLLSVTRKKSPTCYHYTLGADQLQLVHEEKDLGITISSKLSWDAHINGIVAKANKILGVLKRTCLMLTDINTRRTLYLSLVKSQLSYGTQVWSPVLNKQLSVRIERVQRRATKWILRSKSGDMSYKERLVALNMLPLSYDREVKDLVFFFKALYGFIDIDVNDYVSFVDHGRTRLSKRANIILQTPLCRTKTFQSSYFNRIVKPWNYVCKLAHPCTFFTPTAFSNFLKQKYSELVKNVYDSELFCTLSLVRDCPCHRT